MCLVESRTLSQASRLESKEVKRVVKILEEILDEILDDPATATATIRILWGPRSLSDTLE